MDSSSCQEYFERNGHRWLQIHIKSSKWCGICEKLIEGKTKSEQNSFQCLFCKLISHHQCWSNSTTPCSKSPTASTSTIPSSTNSRSTSSYSFFASRSRSFESTSSSNPSSPTSSAAATVAVSSSASSSTSIASGGVGSLVNVTTSTKHPTKKEKESNKSRKEKLKRINQYEILSELGRGACGKVYLVEDVDTRDPSKKKYAMKTFPPIKFQQRNLSRGQKNSTSSSSQETLIRREIAILRRLIHPNVIYLKDVIEEQVSKGFHLYLILEYVDGGILLKSKINEEDPSSSPQFLAPNRPNGFYSEEETSRFFSQILSGLEYLHFNSIAHRDLKPDNILLTSSGVIKLTDFGGSTDFSSGATHSTRNGYVYDTQGTWAFWAPEICRSEDESKYSAFLGDVWAAGIVLFIMLYGTLPFWSDDTNQLFELIENRYLHPEIKLFIPMKRREFRSIRAQEMVESVLIGDPLHRPSITTCQSHPWCQSFVTNESRCDYRTQLLRNSSYQKSVLDLTDEDLSLDHAITPGKAVYISKLLFRKIIKKSNESLQKIAAVISSMDEEDHETHEDENDYNDKERERERERDEREEGGEEDDEKKSKFPKKKNSLRELWRAISLQSPASSERDLVVSDNPLKSNKCEDSNEEGQGQGQGDEKNPSERSRNNQNIENDNDSASIMSSSTDEDDDEEEEAHSTWTWDIFDTSQEFLRRFTDSSSSPSPSSSSSALQLSLPPPPTLPPSPTASSSSNSSMTSLDLLSFQRNLHQWCYLKTLLPTSCSFCKRLVWKTTIGLGGGENIFQCKLCHKIFHQSCCYEEEECCEEGSKGG